MKKILKFRKINYYRQHGVLMLAVVVMIVILGFVGLSATYQYVNNSSAGVHTTDFNQSHYLANSGVEYSQYQSSKKNLTCNGLNINNFSITGVTGVYTSTSSATKANAHVTGDLGASNTTLPMNSTAGFASTGVIYVDNELMRYSGINGKNLTNVVRGAGNTFAATHGNNTVVGQSQCAVTVNGGVPNLTSPSGKSIVTSYLVQQGFSTSFGTVQTTPVITSAGLVALSGTTTVSNPTVTAQSPGFNGSTVLSGSFVSIQNSAATYVGNGSTTVQSSSSNSFQNDIVYNDSTDVNATNLFGLFFSGSKSSIQSQATQMQTTDNLSGTNNTFIWIDGCETITSGNVGSAAAPVILIVNGNLFISGNLTIYGFVYATGSITITNGATINGAVASETGIAIDDSTVTMNAGALMYLYNQYPNALIGHFAPVPGMTTQVSS